MTDDTRPADDSDDARRERAEREAFERMRREESERKRPNPLYFGVVMATIQMAVLLWFMYC